MIPFEELIAALERLKRRKAAEAAAAPAQVDSGKNRVASGPTSAPTSGPSSGKKKAAAVDPSGVNVNVDDLLE